MYDFIRRLAASISFLALFTLASCDNKAAPQVQTVAPAKTEGEPKQPSVEQTPPAPTQASDVEQAKEAQQVLKDDNADSAKSAPPDPTLRANAKGFKTAQECFAVFAALTDSDDPEKDIDRYFSCLSAAKARFETGTRVIALELLADSGDLERDTVRDLIKKTEELGNYTFLESYRDAKRNHRESDSLISTGSMVLDRIAFVKEAEKLIHQSKSPREPGKRLSSLQLTDFEVDGDQAVCSLVDPADPEAAPTSAFFVFENDSWRMAVAGHDWKAKLTSDQEKAMADLLTIGELVVDRTKRIPVERFYLLRTDATEAQLAPLLQLPMIKNIGLEYANITDEFAIRLLDRPRLEVIGFGHTKISDNFLEHLKKFPKIRVYAINSQISKEAAKRFEEEAPGSQIFLEEPKAPPPPVRVVEEKKEPREYEPKHKFSTPEECFRAFCELNQQDELDAEMLMSIMSTAHGKLLVGKRIFDFEAVWQKGKIDDETARNLVKKYSKVDLLKVPLLLSGYGNPGAYMKSAELVPDKPGYMRETTDILRTVGREADGQEKSAEEKPKAPSLVISDIEIDDAQAIATVTSKSIQGEEEQPIHFVLEDGSWRIGLPRLDWGGVFNAVEKEVMKSLEELGTVDVDFGQRRLVSHFIVKKKGVDEAALAPMHKITSWLEVNLQDSNVTDAFVEKLVTSPNLQAISLYGTNVSDMSLVHLSPLRHLKKMDLTNTDVSADAVNRFREEHPDCDIVQGWNVHIGFYLATATSQRPDNDIVVLIFGSSVDADGTVGTEEALKTRSVFQATRKRDVFIAHSILPKDEDDRPKWAIPKDLPAIAIWKRDADAPEFLPLSTTPDQVAEAIEKMAKPPEPGGDKPEN